MTAASIPGAYLMRPASDRDISDDDRLYLLSLFSAAQLRLDAAAAELELARADYETKLGALRAAARGRK